MQGSIIWERAIDIHKTRYLKRAMKYQLIINYMYYMIAILTVFVMVLTSMVGPSSTVGEIP